MRRLSILTFVAVFAMAFVGCTTADNTNVKTNTAMNSNSNVAVVVNNNSNAVMMNSNSTMKSNVSRADYDKDRTKYESDKGTSTIGQGVNDSWIWFKTKGALAAANDLSDSTINVDVDKDVITLKGTVKTAAQKTQAETVAKGIEGQKGVKNELKVDAKDSLSNQIVNGNTNANMKK